MNAEENEIIEFLQARKNTFVSVTDISKALGRGRRFQQDRNWARPILRRMEVDGLLEANDFCEYRVKSAEPEAPDFKEALRMPGASLGDTTIIRIQDA